MNDSNIVAIVTPDFVGPIRNGGVGTAAYWLARQLTAAGCVVEVVYTGPLETGTAESWERHFPKRCGFRFVCLSEWIGRAALSVAGLRLFPEAENLRLSLHVLEYLKRSRYSAIYFQDYLGHGFRTLQYKRAGLGFQDTPCVLTLHSSQRWIREGMARLPQGFPAVELDFQERECARLADQIVAPSRHMAEWAVDRWGLARDRITVVPYCFDEEAGPRRRCCRVFHGFRHLVFFGRLETRKGLHFVLQALQQSRTLRDGLKRVTFLGKNGSVAAGASQVVIPQMLKGTHYSWEIIDDKDAHQAWAWMRRQKDILVVAPSTMDNLPFSIIELFANQVPFVTTDAGGIPEIVGRANRHLLAPVSARGVRECLDRVVGTGQLKIDFRSGFDAVRTNAANVRFHRSLVNVRALAPFQPPEKRTRPDAGPAVSVIVPHFNSTGYLDQALRSLQNQIITEAFEVIVVDDCSSDPVERERFSAMAAKYDRSVFRFVSVARNRGPGAARNHGSRLARGRYLAFLDADNEAEPAMLSTMLRAIESSGYDSLSCFSKVIVQEDRGRPRPLAVKNATLLYSPLGACLETGFLTNIFGDTCSIVRKRVFVEMGGFAECPAPIEDWDLWARLSLSGRLHGIIPEPLFLYRQQQHSYSQSENTQIASKLQILQTYRAHQRSEALDWGSVCAAVVGAQSSASTPLEGGGSMANSIYNLFANSPERELQRFLFPTKRGLSDGLSDVQTMRRRLEPLLAQWEQSQPRVYIYGAGAHTKVLLGILPSLARWVRGYIDQRKLRRFLGRPCLLPEQIDQSQVDVVIYSSKASERQMYARLAHLPLSHVLIYNSLPK